MSSDTDRQMGEPMPIRTTRFSDVCGTTDELKRLLYEEPGVVAPQPEVLRELVADQLYMLGRMELRLREYQQFRDDIGRLYAELGELGDSRRREAAAAAEAMAPTLATPHTFSAEEIAAIVTHAEAIRAVAQHLENTLRAYKESAIAIAQSYERVRGGRPWPIAIAPTPEAEAATERDGTGRASWQAWLPEPPHRDHILEFINHGRAHVIWEDGTGDAGERVPLVQFEDGGLMKLSEVRWSAELGNFYPAGEGEPAVHGRLYRGRHRRGRANTEIPSPAS